MMNVLDLDDYFYFTNRGFNAEKTFFPGLDIVADLPANCYFRNDGIVKDLKEHKIKLQQEMSKILQPNDIYYDSEAAGLHIGIYRDYAKASLMFIKDMNNAYINTLCLGHESTHAVIHFGLEEYLMKALRESGFQIDPFKEYGADEERIADTGGWLAVERLACGRREIVSVSGFNPEELKCYSNLLKSKVR
jgi:hypothetical protein